MTTPRKIGIIGGLGPEATVLLMQKIISATQVNDDQDHIPMIVDNNPQVPSRINALINGTGEDPGPTLAKMAKGLEKHGAEALAMPCNTAHYYRAHITKNSQIPFLDMIKLSTEYVASQTLPSSKIGILASPAVKKIKLFDQALEEVSRATCYPTDNDLMLVAIKNIKKNGIADQEAQKILSDASKDLVRQGVSCSLIACSELSLIADIAKESGTAFDTLDILVSEVIGFAMKDKKNH